MDVSWHRLDPVDESFFDAAPHRYVFPIDAPVPPERMWASLTSDESVAAWGRSVQSVRWLSPRPFGVGTTREVVLPLRSISVHERFVVWDEGRRYAFEVYEANRKVFRRFAENYVIEPRDGGSRLTWTVAMEPLPRLRRLVDLARPLNRLMFGRLAAEGRSYFADHP
jgi:hypothetical protein